MAKSRRPSPPPASEAESTAPVGSRPTDWRLWLAIVLFAGSGCAALIYEVVWFQLLELVVGSSAISLGILLSTYMGGMCLGSLLLPRVVSRRFHPFRVYAVIQLGIGLLALLVLLAVPLMGGLYTGSGAHGVLGVVLRAMIAGLCLAPPTLLMGAALPAIARWVEETPRGVGWLGLLYGSNIAGGVIGCIVAGFFLLRFFDVATATVVGVAMNGLVGLIALQIAWSGNRPAAVSEVVQRPSGWFAGGMTPYVAIGISGLCALAEREARRDRTRVPPPDVALARGRAEAKRRARLARLLSRVRLSEPQGNVLRLYLGEGLGPAEACRTVGVSISVWQNLLRKLKRAQRAA